MLTSEKDKGKTFKHMTKRKRGGERKGEKKRKRVKGNYRVHNRGMFRQGVAYIVS